MLTIFSRCTWNDDDDEEEDNSNQTHYACFPNSWQNLFVQLFFGLCLRHFSSRCHLLRPLENSFRYMLFQSTLVKFISSLKSCVRLIPFIFCETSFYQLDFDIHGELWVKKKKKRLMRNEREIYNICFLFAQSAHNFEQNE